jgi:hypothetical protein
MPMRLTPASVSSPAKRFQPGKLFYSVQVLVWPWIATSSLSLAGSIPAVSMVDFVIFFDPALLSEPGFRQPYGSDEEAGAILLHRSPQRLRADQSDASPPGPGCPPGVGRSLRNTPKIMRPAITRAEGRGELSRPDRVCFGPFSAQGPQHSATGPAPPEVLATTVEVMLTTVGSRPRISADWQTFIVSCATLGEDRSVTVKDIARSIEGADARCHVAVPTDAPKSAPTAYIPLTYGKPCFR